MSMIVKNDVNDGSITRQILSARLTRILIRVNILVDCAYASDVRCYLESIYLLTVHFVYQQSFNLKLCVLVNIGNFYSACYIKIQIILNIKIMRLS